MRQSWVMAAGGSGAPIMGRLQALRIGRVLQDDVAVLERQPGVGEHGPHSGSHSFDAVRRGGRDFVQEVGDIERPDVEKGAGMQRLAVNQQGVTQAVAGFSFLKRGEARAIWASAASRKVREREARLSAGWMPLATFSAAVRAS